MAEGWFAGPAPPAEPAVAAEPAPEIRPAPMDAPAVAPHLRAGRAGRAGRAEPAVAAEPAPEIRPAPTAAPAVAPHLRAARNAPVPAEPAPDVRPAPTDAPAPAEPAPPPPIEHDPTTLRHLQNNEIPAVLACLVAGFGGGRMGSGVEMRIEVNVIMDMIMGRFGPTWRAGEGK
ncbi:hypothetical protein B0A50_07988 [Salinomyces thailandicus]|uniref:Uncharacterized protein n=1 Tax=Salinomyces thailandicus TaxID=706561 RepID=A0A4U0TLC3_9PEZI|nr:hypothetical protein B0A50_07988 [Salinomyces thailandica]